MLRVVYTPRYSDSCRFTLHGGAAEPGAGGEAGDEHESIYFLDLKECRYRQFYRVLYTHYIRSYTTSYVYMSSTSIYITTEERSNVGEPESSAFRTGGSVSRTRRFSRGVIYTLIPCSLIFLFNSRYLYSVLSNPYVLSSQQDRFYHPNNLVSISTPDLVPVSTVPRPLTARRLHFASRRDDLLSVACAPRHHLPASPLSFSTYLTLTLTLTSTSTLTSPSLSPRLNIIPPSKWLPTS